MNGQCLPCIMRDMNSKSIRERRGLRQEDLADMACISQSAVSRAEAGDESVTFGKFKAIAAALDVPISEIFADRSRREVELVELFRSLTVDQQERWLVLSRAFAQDQPATPHKTR